MGQRFTVIHGGLAGDPTEPVDGAPVDAWRVDLSAAAQVDEVALLAWRDLLERTGTEDPLRDPDYLLTAARHQARGRQIAFALTWSRHPGGPEMLCGVLPLAIRHPLWGSGRARLWWPPGLSQPALVDRGRATMVERALRLRLDGLRRPVALEAGWHAPEPAGALTGGGPRRPIPPEAMIGVRPAGYRPPPQIERVNDPAAIRDAVEAFLALDARTARKPIVADPGEASMVRVVTRLFARRRAVTVELATRAGEVVAASLHLGTGGATIPWRQAALPGL